LRQFDILSYEEVIRVIEAAVTFGIKKIRLTGGEPLVRRNVIHLIRAISQRSGVEDFSITTNGVFLKPLAQAIFKAGVRRINVSLDTLNPLKYVKITRRNCFRKVWEGISLAERIGFRPIRLNVVVMRGLNDDEILQFADLSIRKPYQIRFIEYMPLGVDNNWTPQKYVSSDEIKSRLESMAPLYPVTPEKNDGPALRYRFASAKGEIGLIRPLSHHFCATCNRLRLTAEGKLRPCLFSDKEVDLKTPLRRGCSQQDLIDLFRKAIGLKPKKYDLKRFQVQESQLIMRRIGG